MISDVSALTLYQILALFLLGVGLFGILYRRSLIGMLICVELMLNGAALSIAAGAQLTPMPAEMGQAATLFVMGLAAAEATLVLAIVLVVVRRFGNAETETVSRLKG